MSGATVRLEGVVKRYGREIAVGGVDLELAAGACIALVGHNGAGKSTLIKLMLGLIRPTEGRVAVLGEDPAAGLGARARREIGYLPENLALHPAMTAIETLAFYARLKRQPLAGNAALLKRVGLGAAARRRVGTYSKGMRQRLGLAQALLGRPRLLLLDEPTTGLDPALRQHFYEIVRELRDAGATVLLSSHALAELEGQVDRVVIMSRGRKVADGTIHALRRLADRPVRVRVLLPGGGAPPGGAWRALGGGRFELASPAAESVGVVRTLADGPAPEALEVLPPSLDEIYADFLERKAAQ
ncbi:MAG: ABC transporter ATP-binding protein [Dongiaceae bacterium]